MHMCNVCICICLVPSLGQCLGDSLTNPILIIAFFNSCYKGQQWSCKEVGSKPDQAPVASDLEFS